MEPVLTNGDMKRTSQGKSNQTRNMTLKPHLLQIKRVEFIPKCVTFKILQNCPSRSAAALSKLIFLGLPISSQDFKGVEKNKNPQQKFSAVHGLMGKNSPTRFSILCTGI